MDGYVLFFLIISRHMAWRLFCLLLIDDNVRLCVRQMDKTCTAIHGVLSTFIQTTQETCFSKLLGHIVSAEFILNLSEAGSFYRKR